LLQLESVPKEVVVAKLGDSEKVEVGDEVLEETSFSRWLEFRSERTAIKAFRAGSVI
jgi:hypothetical protein